MGTHYKGSKKEVNALNVYLKLKRAADSVTARVNAALSKSGLTESQFNALDALYHLGSLTQRELGEKLAKSGGNITLVIDNLEKQGYVQRERGQQDRRCFMINLTNKGKKVLEQTLPAQVAAITEQMGILNEKEQQEFQKSCKKIGTQQKKV